MELWTWHLSEVSSGAPVGVSSGSPSRVSSGAPSKVSSGAPSEVSSGSTPEVSRSTENQSAIDVVGWLGTLAIYYNTDSSCGCWNKMKLVLLILIQGIQVSCPWLNMHDARCMKAVTVNWPRVVWDDMLGEGRTLTVGAWRETVKWKHPFSLHGISNMYLSEGKIHHTSFCKSIYFSNALSLWTVDLKTKEKMASWLF